MFKPLSLFLAVLLLSVWTGEFAAQAGTPDELTVKGSTEVPFAVSTDTHAVWSGGALLVAQDRFSGVPVFQVFDREGKQLSQFTFTMSGAGLINIYDHSFARGLDGSLAIIGSAYSGDSRGAAFLAWVSSDGQEQVVVRTSPFIPRALTVASDGTIWVAGKEEKVPGEEPDRSQHVIRHYDKTGKMLGSFISWSSLGIEPHTLHPAENSILISSRDRIGWYSPDAHTYIEFSLDGAVINRIKTAEHPKHSQIGVALCDDGSLFVSASILNGPRQNASWGIFSLHRDRGEWSFIPRSESWGMMYGCDGTRLATTTNFTTISWLEPAGK